MKKLVSSLIVILLLFTGCSLNQTSDTSLLKIDKSKIQQINITNSPPTYGTISTTDKQQISDVLNYLNSLNVSETNKDPGTYCGGGWSIEMKMKNNKDKIFYLNYNMFFIETNNFTYEIPYEQAIEFDTIIGDIMQSNEIETGESLIQGTVLSFNFENSDKTICIIKDKDENTHNIDISNAMKFDSTGNGHLQIYINDEVNIYYQNQDSSADIIAKSVFVTKSMMK